MSEIYDKWTSESEYLEFLRDYKVVGVPEYEFTHRQDDYYITLLNKLYLTLENINNSNEYESYKNELLKIAHGLNVYSSNSTREIFSGVDVALNQLYVSAIYYLCDFGAISTLLIKGLEIKSLDTESAKLIYLVLSGGKHDDVFSDNIYKILNFVHSGEKASLDAVINSVNQKYAAFSFDSLDDFFDTFLLIHILIKYNENNIWVDLKEAAPGIDWRQYVAHSFEQHIISFLPSQKEAISKGVLNFEKSFSLTMPTSSGKSYLTELIIYNELQKDSSAKVLYLAPLRSLAYELKQRFSKVSNSLGFTYRAMYGGGSYSWEESYCLEAQLLVSTPETFMTLEGSIDNLLNEFSLIICDEGQLLDDLSRGINYELLLSRLKKIGHKRFLFISAIIPNIEDINTWLGGTAEQIGSSTYRPAKIKFGYSKNDKGNIELELYNSTYTNCELNIPTFVSKKEIGPNITTNRKQSAAIALKSLNAGSVMIYTSHKNGNRGCAAFGNDVLSLINGSDMFSPINFSLDIKQLQLFIEYISYQFGDEYALVNFAKNGFVYHNADIPQDIREYIEYYYTKKVLPLIICTSTLAEGVNLPVKTLVLGNIQTQNKYNGYLTDRKSLKNIIGRVGRAGREKYGLIILPASSTKKPLNRVLESLRNERIERISGTLFDIVEALSEYRGDLDDTQINSVLEANNFAKDIDFMISRNTDNENIEDIDLDNIIIDSLAYHLGDVSTKKWLRKIFEIRYQLLKAEINTESYGKYRLSGLSISQYKNIEELVTFDNDAIFCIANPLDDDWLGYIIDLLYELDIYDRYDKINDKEELKSVLRLWMQGLWYHEIAYSVNKDVEDVLVIINHIKGEFKTKVSSIIRYIIDSKPDGKDMLAVWPEFASHGIDSIIKYFIRKRGITDRIGINTIYKYFMNNNMKIIDYEQFNAIVDFRHSEIREYINTQAIPALTKRHIYRNLI